MLENYYDILGVDINVSEPDLKKAYHKKLMEFHPDRNPGDKGAPIKFQEVVEAYQALKSFKRPTRIREDGEWIEEWRKK